MKRLILSACLLTALTTARSQTAATQWNTPGAGNPFIPGYFADPTIRKFGDTYYLYATTDGNGNGYGPAQVWMSRDFRNWTNMTMDWPTTEVVWAPDVMQGADGLYHYFYCEPCVLHEGVGHTPRGPWTNILGETDAVLVPDRFVHNAITLDGQTFVDDDGSVYIYFGTWGIYDGFGCGVARLGADMKSFTDKKLIPNTEIKDFFEAPFVLKRGGTYYFMYSSGSCHDHTYRVQYATSTEGPMGPYTYRGCILETNADRTVHGPGHHSVLRDGDDYYIVYHRHNNPPSTHGFHRQVCIDRLVFAADGSIEKITPSHAGLLPRSVADMPAMTNLAFGAKVTASSHYNEWFVPEYAVDDNNATLWRPASCTADEWLQIDLGAPTRFDQVWTQFEYATYFYQYRISYSLDGHTWHRYADRERNTLAASPYVDRGACTARYLRITVTGRQKNGHFGGIWNVKVLNGANQVPPQLQVAVRGDGQWDNTAGMLGGSFEADGERLVSTFDTHFIFAKGQPYSMVYERQGQTYAFVSDGQKKHPTQIAPASTSEKPDTKPAVRWQKGRLEVEPDVHNLRVYTYQLQPAEIQHLAQHPVEQAEKDVSDKPSDAPLVHVQATAPASGVRTMQNLGVLGGLLESREPLDIKQKLGLSAFRFSGRQLFRSDFRLPTTLRYSAPYTMSAWVLNPQVERLECVAQLSQARNDLSTAELCNGSDPQNGLMRHNASYENSGSPLIAQAEGQWQHWVVTYDGYMERHYLNGRQVSEKNMMLLLRPQGGIQLGASAGGADAFDGYLHAFSLYDRTLAPTEIEALYALTAPSVQQRTEAEPVRHVEQLGFGLERVSMLDPEGDPLPGGLPVITRHDEKGVVAVKPVWHTLSGSTAQQASVRQDGPNAFTLTSAGADFNAPADRNGPLHYVTVQGDFLAEVQVTDLSADRDLTRSGLRARSTPAYNEGGLMLMDDSDPSDQRFVQHGVFPAYNCGNMLTTVSHRGRRPQYQRGNGWRFDPYLQLQREGTLVYTRSSRDGKEWTDMPNSPVDLTELGIAPDAPLKLGIFQVTYTDNAASMSFADFRLWQRTASPTKASASAPAARQGKGRSAAGQNKAVGSKGKALTAKEAEATGRALIAEWTDSVRKATAQTFSSHVMTIDTLSMPLAWRVKEGDGTQPRPLYISLHGGGGAPPQLNDQQWQNQQVLYNTDGVYLCPRAPFNTWDLHFRPQSDEFYQRIIGMMVAHLNVDPNRVYLMGYSAGGDGVWRLAPRMADTWAAASMMAGHPGDVRLDNLYNLPFMIWCGAEDKAYDRNLRCTERIAEMDSLHRAHPDGYRFEGHIVEGKAHWMDRVDTAAVGWMAQSVRQPYPKKVVWRQEEVLKRNFYWIGVPGNEVARGKEVCVERNGNTIDISKCDYTQLTLYLNDEMLSLDRPVTVRYRGATVFSGKLIRTAATMRRTLFSRNDPAYMFAAEVCVATAHPQ